MHKYSRVVLPFLEEETHDYTNLFDNLNFTIRKRTHQKSEQEQTLELIKKGRSEEEFKITEQTRTFIHKAENKKHEKFSLVRYHYIKGLDYDKNDDISEIVFLRKLEHPNILKFYDPVIQNDKDGLAFLFEPHHSLLSSVIEERIDLLYETRIVKNIMKQLFTALDYLHSKHVIHRDIRPDNILFTSTGVLKIWNFRNAQWTNQKNVTVKTYEYGYQPLELLLELEKCSTAVDMWSAGCIFAELLLKKTLFPMKEKENLLKQIFAIFGFPTKEIYKELYDYPLLFDLFSYKKHHYNCLDLHINKNSALANDVSVLNLLHACLMYDPKERITANEVLEHKYFSAAPTAYPDERIVKVLESSNISKRLREFKNCKKV